MRSEMRASLIFIISIIPEVCVMENIVIILVIALIAVFAVRSAAKHFQGKGGCCGGSDYTPKKKRLDHVAYKKTFHVDGMECEHCKNRVTEVVNDIPGVAGAVDLKKGVVVVSYAQNVDDALIKERIERAGYTVSAIE